MEILNYSKNGFEISTDRSRLDVQVIHRFLSEESYWAKNISMEAVKCSVENSLCYGMYYENRQIGFAKVITDFATTAYLGDVFILKEYRGKGLSHWLMTVILSHPRLQNLRRWILATKDAHGLYTKSGFGPLAKPERWMELHKPDAYVHSS